MLKILFVCHMVAIIIPSATALNTFLNATIKCEERTECNIDCVANNCDYHVIDGTHASSLTVNCSTGSDGCIAVQVICPDYPRSRCSISCFGDEACYQTMIRHQATTDFLSLSCGGFRSCGFLTIQLSDISFMSSLNISLSQLYPIYPTTLTHAHRGDNDMGIEYFHLNCTRGGCDQLVLDLYSVPISNADIICTSEADMIAVAWSFLITSLINIHLDAQYNYASITTYLLNDANLYLECVHCGFVTFVVKSGRNMQRNENNNTAYINCTSCLFSSVEKPAGMLTGFYFHDVKVVMECGKDYGCVSDIDAAHAQSFDLICNQPYSCMGGTILCPYYAKDVCNIKCGTNGCYHIEISVGNDFVTDYLHWDCPKNWSYSVYFGSNCGIDFYCIDYEGKNESKLPTELVFDHDTNEYKCKDNSDDFCCPNAKIIETKDADYTWLIIGITFICLFFITLFIALYYVCKQSSKYQKVKREDPQEADAQIETETLKEN